MDVNEAMLAVARDAGWGLRPPIDWRRGDAVALPVDDESVDVVTCQQALQFLPDREAALREMRRVLVPGGRVAVAVLRSIRHNPGWEALAVLLERYTGSDAMRAPFPDLDAAELRELATSAGFRRVRVQILVAGAHYPLPEHVIRWEAALAPPGGSAARPRERDRGRAGARLRAGDRRLRRRRRGALPAGDLGRDGPPVG